MKSNVKVHEVNQAPAIGKPEMQQGIRTREAAENWAIKNGYTVVYLFKKHERVYADKTSRQQLVFGEQGSSCLEFVFLLALVVFVLVVVLKDVPW